MQALIGITQLLKLCLRSNKLGIIILGITTILNAILNFYIIRLTGQFVDYIEKDFLMSQSYNNSIILILIIIGSIGILYILKTVGEIITEKMVASIEYTLINEKIKVFCKIDYPTLVSGEYQDDLKATDRINSWNILMSVTDLFYTLQSIITIVSMGMLLGITAGPIAIIGAVIIILIDVICRWFFAKENDIFYRDTQRENRTYDYVKSLYFDSGVAQDLAIFDFKQFLAENLDKSYTVLKDKALDINYRQSIKKIGIKALASIVIGCVTVITFMKGDIISLGGITIVFTSLKKIQFESINLGATIGGILEFYRSVVHFEEFTDKYNTREVYPKSEDNSHQSLDKKIHFNNVSFTYPTGEKVLENINLTINEGESLAIVGENGAGKSTLINIMLGLYDVEEGSVHVCGKNPYKIMQANLPTDIIAVQQQISRYEGISLKESISLGRDISYEELSEFNNLFTPEILDSVVGEGFNGRDFSGGEWQKIALARTIGYNAPILVLDEPTSALDPMAELEVFNQFLHMHLDKTKVLITHRLGAVRNCDRIIVLGNHTIQEEGSHDELMNQKGLYYEMFMAQAQWYKTVDLA